MFLCICLFIAVLIGIKLFFLSGPGCRFCVHPHRRRKEQQSVALALRRHQGPVLPSVQQLWADWRLGSVCEQPWVALQEGGERLADGTFPFFDPFASEMLPHFWLPGHLSEHLTCLTLSIAGQHWQSWCFTPLTFFFFFFTDGSCYFKVNRE